MLFQTSEEEQEAIRLSLADQQSTRVFHWYLINWPLHISNLSTEGDYQNNQFGTIVPYW